MSLTQPTVRELNDSLIAQLEAQLGQTIPLLPRSFLRVLAKVLAATYVTLFKYAGFIFEQMFVSTAAYADVEINGRTVNPLQTLGRQYGVGDLAPATFAQLVVSVTVERQGGTLILGTPLVNPATGITYLTVASTALDLAVVPVTVKATTAGVDGNIPVGSTLRFASPQISVATQVTVSSVAVTGSDGESVDAYRQRILDRWQVPPQGGALTDYRIWGEDPSGILNVYPYNGSQPGQIDLYVESATETDGIPTASQLDAVLASVEYDVAGLASRRPAGALIPRAFSIIRTPFDVTVSGLVVSDLATVRGQIEEGIKAYFLSREPYTLGVTVAPRKDQVVRTSVGAIVDAVVSSAGGYYSSIVMLSGTTPTDVYELGQGEKAKLGTLSYA